MAKKKSLHLSAGPIITVAVGLALLIGIAYVANNTVASQAAISRITSTKASDYTLPKSPYPECQALLDTANKKIISDTQYKKLLDTLGKLLKEADDIQRQIDALVKQGKGNSNETLALRWQLYAKQAEIKKAQIAVNEYRSNIFAAYNSCVIEAQHKTRPWWPWTWKPTTTTNTATPKALTPTTSTLKTTTR